MVNQVKGGCKREDVFAAPPPIAVMRFILSRAASRGHGRCLGLWDVSVAFFHAAIEEEVFVRPPKNMRKDKTIWELKQAMYGTQVASSRWQWMVRETLCHGHWWILTSVPCVAYNEKEASLVLFHGDDFLAKVHDSTLCELDEVLGAFEIRRLPRMGPAAGRGRCLSAQKRHIGANLDSCADQIQTRGRVGRSVLAERCETCCNTSRTGHWKGTS